ncbi:MAG: deoxyribonuclease V [Dehalococcoidia bacterium]|nr:deoxyribonuclease V [Dehalococcoidia bacterium]
MKLHHLHPWDISTSQARELQKELAGSVSTVPALPDKVRYLAGLDISPADASGVVRGAAVVLEYPSLEPVEVKTAGGKPPFPYIPGLLSFRESPVLLEALEQLETHPDVIYIDGQGLAHPRRFGLACHIGLLTRTPTIGCAKSILVGSHHELPPSAGAHSRLEHKGEEVGAAVRTRDKVRPMYVSPGHLIDIDTSIEWVLASCRGRRMPEPTRKAHEAADRAHRSQIGS